MTERMLRRPELKKRVPLSDSTIYAMMDPNSSQFDPSFPKPVRLGKRAVAWLESEVDAWQENRQRAEAA